MMVIYFVDIWERGVGYVPSCGTATAAAALLSNNKTVEVYCRGGKYIIEKDLLQMDYGGGKYFLTNP